MPALVFLLTVFLAAAGVPASAQTGGAVVGTGPGVGGVAQTVKLTATITKIDQQQQAVTVEPAGGRRPREPSPKRTSVVPSSAVDTE